MTIWPTATSQPIRLSTNFMTFIPSLTFTELRVVSMEYLQRVWLASRERLPFRTPGFVPFFGTCLCSNCWDQIPRICQVFARLFTLNTPWYFLDFALRYLPYTILIRLHIICETFDFKCVVSPMVLAQAVRPVWCLQGTPTKFYVCPWYLTSDLEIKCYILLKTTMYTKFGGACSSVHHVWYLHNITIMFR